MIEKLDAARNLLNHALDTYISVCSAIQSHCTLGVASEDAPRLEELVDYATKELRFFDSFHAKLKQAEASMSVARNCSSALVPIHALPPEILSRIFQQVIETQECIGEGVLTTPTSYHYRGPNFPEYPDLLSIICYHWRQIALGSNTLWSHIDLIPRHHFNKRLLTRAKGYADRAGQSLLDIHIIDQTYSGGSDDADATQFLRSVATRIRSLELVASDASTRFHHSILHASFTHCVPGIFKQFRVIQYHGPQFIEAAESPFIVIDDEDPYAPKSLLLDIPRQSLEDIWLPMTSLRLSGLYPYWNSSAYHGLVELHLFPKGKHGLAPITESQLLEILKASSGLRVLYFNLKITESRPQNAYISESPVGHVDTHHRRWWKRLTRKSANDKNVTAGAPSDSHYTAHLDNLEVLNVSLLSYDQLQIFLRLISPGSKPLQLCFELPVSSSWSTFSSGDEVNRFLARSNVANLYLDGLDACLTQVAELLQFTPHLRVLALEDFFGSTQSDFVPTSSPNEPNVKLATAHLDHLYMLKCSFDLDLVQVLEQILKGHTVEQLTLWDCSYHENQNSYSDQDALKNSVLNIYPTALFLDRDAPSPIKEWDV